LLDLTETDSLTELFNCRFLVDKIEYLKCQFERNKISFSTLMGDIDNFKEVNDTYGHNLGDRALVQLAETIKETVRKQDFLRRCLEIIVIILQWALLLVLHNIMKSRRQMRL